LKAVSIFLFISNRQHNFITSYSVFAMDTKRILIAGFQDSAARELLRRIVQDAGGFQPEFWPLEEEGVSSRKSYSEPAAIILFLPHRPEEGRLCFESARQNFAETPIIAAIDATRQNEWSELLRLGISDFITPPFRSEDLLPRLWRVSSPSDQSDVMIANLKEKLGLRQVIGESAALVGQIRLIPTMARSNAHVLIAGETGTGKEMFARAIHHLSARSAKPLSAITCGAIPGDLMENELFGHEAGAFTGAMGASPGLLRATDGGSLFLDEVDTLPVVAQVKLLRFLQEKEFRPLGSHKLCHADVRVIAASNVNLDEAVRKGKFREDLYFRLNVLTLTLPPLRERKEDIPVLARHFLNKHSVVLGGAAREFSAAALQKLTFHHWPGNVRELENTIQRAALFCSGRVVRAEDIKLPVPTPAEGISFRALKAKVVTQFERGYIEELLQANQGNISKAARVAGKNRRAFFELIRKHQIKVRVSLSS
jgi:two-component system, NtrC family, response regulator GlrR